MKSRACVGAYRPETTSKSVIDNAAGEHDSILRRDPDGHMEVVVRDPRIIWPDGIFATDSHVYCTLGQWNRLPSFNRGKDLRQPPYLLVRAAITSSPEIER